VTCRELADFIVDYLTGELTPAVQAAFERHLDVCINCRRYLKSYEETVKLGRHAFDDEDALVPAVVPEELVQAILAARLQ
jgi:anti-sigma factor RsiW